MNIFTGALEGINSVLGNYGWSVIVFTFLVRLILFPFDYKSRVGMRKTTKIQPEMQRLQKKYANDKDKLNQKMAELYKKEKVNPLSSCLPLLLSYPILIMMFNAMREVAAVHAVDQVLHVLQNPTVLPPMENWLWVRNVWMPDSPFSSALPDLNMLRQISGDTWKNAFAANADQWAAAIASYPDLVNLTVDSFSGNQLQNTLTLIANALNTTPIYQEAAGSFPGWTFNLLIAQFSIMKEWNGLFLLPLLSALSQFAMTKITPTQPAANADPQQQSTGKFMTWFFPLFSLWICSTSNGMFSLYWVASNLVMMAQTWGINKYLDAKDAKAAVSGEGSVK